MYLLMGRGGGQAIEDGPPLAACLAAAAGDVPVALKRYERLRLPRVSRIQALSRANKTRFHLPDGPQQEARDAAWAQAGDRSPDALRWLYAHDPAALEPPAETADRLPASYSALRQ
jgi:salicylate hydroxylase